MLGKIQMVSPVVLILICGKKQKQNRTAVEGSWVLRRDIQSHTYTAPYKESHTYTIPYTESHIHNPIHNHTQMHIATPLT